MPKLLKNSMAWHQIYQKIQNLDIFYSISQENNLKDCGTNSSEGKCTQTWFLCRRPSSPVDHQWTAPLQVSVVWLRDSLPLHFSTSSTTRGFMLVWGRVNCNQIVVRFRWITFANFRIRYMLCHCLAELECHFLQTSTVYLGSLLIFLNGFRGLLSMHSFNLSLETLLPIFSFSASFLTGQKNGADAYLLELQL